MQAIVYLKLKVYMHNKVRHKSRSRNYRFLFRRNHPLRAVTCSEVLFAV